MKRILILGSLEEFTELVKLAKKRGHYTLVCDKNERGPAKEWADKVYHIDVREIEKIVQICKDEKVEVILTAFSDLLLECMVKIADRAGIACYLSPDSLPWYRDKRAMKEMFAKLAVETPKSVLLTGDFGDEELAELCFPLAIKPVDMYGSRGVFVVDKPAQIRELFEESCKSSSLKNILAEEYHDGYEFNVTAWVLEGEAYILSIADREKTQVVKGQIPINTRNVYPSLFTEQVYEESKEILNKIVSFTGQKQGELSMQFFWKPGQKIRVCEVAARFLGYEHELVSYCGNLSLEEILLDHAEGSPELEEKVKGHDPFLKSFGAVLYFQGKEEVIEDMEGLKEAFLADFVKESQIFYKEGDRIESFKRPYLARCYILAESREDLDQMTDKIFSRVSVKGKGGQELLYKNQRTKYKEERQS